MINLKMFRSQYIIFKYLLLTYIGCAVADYHCCPPNLALLLRKNVCWNPKTNETSAILLKCSGDPVRFRQQFTITKSMDLNLKLGDDFDETFPAESFCVNNSTNIRDVTFKNITPVALICPSIDEQILDDKILGYCLIVSIIFLVPTALIYSAIPELRDVQGKSIINFCISLSIGQGILVIMKLMEYSDMSLCAVRGFLAYFFLIAAFFWSNAIAIQVLKHTKRPATLDYSWHEFKWYFMYAWGIPTILTVGMAIVNFHPGKHAKPGIGLNHCWFFSKAQQWYYMFSVMSILLAANIAIFIYISLMLCRLSFPSSHLRALRYKFTMSVRLIILMGLPWVFEMIGSLAGPHIIWSIIDVFNCLQGILIFFLLVVFRRRVVKLMYSHGWLDGMSGLVERHLAVEDDEENVVQHTDVPVAMTEHTDKLT